jgi:hypothetical protein
MRKRFLLRFFYFAILILFIAACNSAERKNISEESKPDSMEVSFVDEKLKTDQCVFSPRTYYKKCACGDGRGGTVQKTQTCIDYYDKDGKLCRTECESCYNVCNRP